MRVARFARTQQQQRVALTGPLEQREASAFADGNAAASAIERPARFRRQQLKRAETTERRETKRINAADDCGIDEAGTQQPRRGRKDFGARRARGGNGIHRAARADRGRDKRRR